MNKFLSRYVLFKNHECTMLFVKVRAWFVTVQNSHFLFI